MSADASARLGVSGSATPGEIRWAYLTRLADARATGAPPAEIESLHEAYAALTTSASEPESPYRGHSPRRAHRAAPDPATDLWAVPLPPDPPPSSSWDAPPHQPSMPSWAVPPAPPGGPDRRASPVVDRLLHHLEWPSVDGRSANGVLVFGSGSYTSIDVLREVRARLGAADEPTLRLTHASDKHKSGTMNGGLSGWLLAFVAPLRTLNGERYHELVFECADPRRVIAERRDPATGRPISAWVIEVIEAVAIPGGRPSRSLREWLDRTY